jgi:hypothetical protein
MSPSRSERESRPLTWRRETYVPRPRPEGETRALIRASIGRAAQSVPRDRHEPACYRGGIR